MVGDGGGDEWRDGGVEARRRKAVRGLKKKGCAFGVTCWYGGQGRCYYEHSEGDHEHFGRRATLKAEEAALRCVEIAAPCAFCAMGTCRWGKKCRRRKEEDSEYESADEFPVEDEATGQDVGCETVAGRTVAVTSEIERQREERVRKQEFEGRMELEGKAAQRDEVRARTGKESRGGVEQGYTGMFSGLPINEGAEQDAEADKEAADEEELERERWAAGGWCEQEEFLKMAEREARAEQEWKLAV